MGNQTTFSTISRESETESAGSKIASSVSEVMKIPKNMFLLAETGVSMERLHDVMQAADHTLSILEKAGAEGGIPLPHFTQILCKELDAGEALLNRCQDKVNELVGLHSDSCSNSHIQKLVDKLSSCKKENVNVRERSKYFLPVGSTDHVEPASLFNEDFHQHFGLMAEPQYGAIVHNIQHEARMASDMESVTADSHKDTSFDLSCLFYTDSTEEHDIQCWAERTPDTSFDLSCLFYTDSTEEHDIQCWAERTPA